MSHFIEKWDHVQLFMTKSNNDAVFKNFKNYDSEVVR